MTSYELILEAVQYGFKYAQESQHDGESVPIGNIEQWIMWKKGFLYKEELELFKQGKMIL